MYLQEQLNRLQSLYHEVVIIHAAEPVRYGMFLTQWVKDHPENFSEVIVRKDVFTYGAGPAGLVQAREMLDADPDEVWKFETSRNSMRRPDHAIYPELWYMAACEGVPVRVFRAAFRKSKSTGRLYEQQTDADGFPEAITARNWDAVRNGVNGSPRAAQRYSNNPVPKIRKNRKRKPD